MNKHKIYLKAMVCDYVNWICIVQTLENLVIKLQIPQMSVNILTSCVTISF
jgi:hypothetical protein